MAGRWPKDVRSYIAAALDQGWTIRSKGPHEVLVPPRGGLPVAIASSPSDRRATVNFRAKLRQRGVDIPHPKKVSGPK
jgi:hypothetical protein